MIRIPHPVLVVSLLSSIFTPHYTSPIIIIHHHHPSSSIIILHHPSSSIIILHHPSFIMIMYRWEPQNCKLLDSRRSFWRRSGFISRSTWGHPGVIPQPGPLCEGEWVGVKRIFEKYSFPTRSFQGGWVGWNINSEKNPRRICLEGGGRNTSFHPYVLAYGIPSKLFNACMPHHAAA